MLHPFISVAASGRIHPTFTTASTAVHAAVLLLVVAPTQSVRYSERPQAALEQVQFAIASFGNVPLRVARALVTTQLGAEELRRARAIVVHSVPEPTTDLVFPEFTYEMAEVEVQAVPAPVNPKPQYPVAMQRRQLEARFAVYFVVDTSGRVDPGSVELPLVSHEEFTNAVLDALEKWRFEPAEVGGHRVRERVKQPFYFRLQ
jgi:TonB family protein